MQWQFSNEMPIYSQLVEQIKIGIVSGMFPPGERLPSVRDLATEAGVNPNTMQRALAGLDAEGLTVTNRTSGRTVTEDASVLEGMRAKLARELIGQFYEAAEQLGYTREQALELLVRSEG